MRDDQLRIIDAFEMVHAAGDNLKRVNIQTRVSFIEHGKFRIE